MKTAMQMVQDCEALQELEHLTADNWHDMAEADACLVAAPYGLGQTTRGPSVRGTSKGGAAPPDVRPLVSRLHAGRHDTGGAVMTLGPPIRGRCHQSPTGCRCQDALTGSEALAARTGRCMRLP